jgi:coenzyme F420-0:L-glutamate ligase/coenzyme F420-1:gamma-L-glutamate ligase
MMRGQLSVTALPGLPAVEPGDNIAGLVIASMERAGLCFTDGDLLVIAQKIISKAENRYVFLSTVTPSVEAAELAVKVEKDPRLVELILRESTKVLRWRTGAVIVKHRNGYVHANAGIDQSNIFSDPDNPRVLLLPVDSDASAANLRQQLRHRCGADVAIIINDSAGRAWRQGIAGFAIGTAGFQPLENRIGAPDLYGRPLNITQVAVADELAAAASFLMGQGAEGTPAVLIRGAALETAETGSAALIRPAAEDLFQ